MPSPRVESPLANVVWKPANSLRVAEYNPRFIGRADFERLRASIKEDPDFFPLRPCLVNTHEGRENVVFAGAQRYRAAVAEGWPDIPCIEVNIALEKERLWNLKDNNHAGEWNEQELAELVWDATQSGANAEDFAVAGFSQERINALLAAVGPYGDDPQEALPLGIVEADEADIGKLPEERFDVYERTQIRQIFLHLSIDQYNRALDLLDRLRSHYNVETNADAILRLMEDWHGGALVPATAGSAAP